MDSNNKNNTINANGKQTIELLGLVRKNAQMGTITLERLAEKLTASGRGMADAVARQLDEYRLIADAAARRSRDLGEEPEDVCPITRAAALAAIGLQSVADKSPSHIAEMIIIGSTRGMISALRSLRTLRAASSDAAGLACRLLVAEQTNIETMKAYI